MSWIKASIATSLAQLIRLAGGLILIKLVASNLGPDGFGHLGHFMSFIAILGVLAGGGILNGMVKYVAEYKFNRERLISFLSNALAYALFFSTIIFFIMAYFAKAISLLFFNTIEFSGLIIFLASIQYIYALVNLCNGLLNGLRETLKFSKVIVVGTIFGLPFCCYFVIFYGFSGAVIALALVNASLLIPAFVIIFRMNFFHSIKFSFNKKDSMSLFKFTMMQMVSLATLPIVEIYIRGFIAQEAGWHSAGLWQSMVRLSAVNLVFFSSFLSVYFVPTLSGMTDNDKSYAYVCKYILGIGSFFILVAGFIYIFRSFVFSMIFSPDFIIPSRWLAFQLLGDFFKIMAYVIGFYLLAKARLRLYVTAELIQSSLYLTITFAFAKFGDFSSVFPAYAVTYFIYFLICILAFYLLKRSFDPDKKGLISL